MEHDELLEVQVGQCRSYGRSKCWGICALDFDPEAAATPEHEIPPLIGGISWYAMGPVGFEPTTKGFTWPRRFRREWTISSPVRSRLRVWVRDAPSLSSRALEPSGSLCTFRRCTGGSAQDCHGITHPEGFPEYIPSTSRASPRRHVRD